MNTKMNGQKVSSFRAYDDHGNPHDIRIGCQDFNPLGGDRQDKVTDIYLSATYHGDHDEFWIIEVIGDRLRRHSLKAVDYFETHKDSQ